MVSEGQRPGPGAEDHDQPDQWMDPTFVQNWVTRDDGRLGERGPMINDTVAKIPFAKDTALSVLDVGAGYGLLSSAVLGAFPNAKVTLQDVSDAMFTHARERLASFGDRTSYVTSDFSQRDWTAGIDGPFDVAVSAIAIHNMYDDDRISAVYKDIRALLAANGALINLDYAAQSGGIDAHVAWLKEAGFSRVETSALNDRIAILAAYCS
jgi:tRNA (cmo5U34)-methyltransferase